MSDINIKETIKDFGLEHIAIIMDGNGRWAKKKNQNRTEGHKIGSERVIEITRYCNDLGIKYLSLYAFSTENWKRPQDEVNTIMSLLNKFINRELDELHKNNVKLVIMGDIAGLPFLNRKAVEYAINKTKDNTGLVLNIGLNYGSRAEITKSIENIIDDINNNIMSKDEINENLISDYLYTKEMPDPDLLIRTGGEIRLSNFMLYQLAYSEFYFTDILWPDFDKNQLLLAIKEFIRRDRRFGGVDDE